MQTKIKLVIIAAVALSFIIFYGNADKEYANSVCGYHSYAMNEQCLQNKFVGKNKNAEIIKYLKAAKFERMEKMSRDDRAIFIREDDTEKGPGEVIAFVDYSDGQIANVKLHKWHSNWYSDAKTGELIKDKSRLRSCLEKHDDCDHLINRS